MDVNDQSVGIGQQKCVIVGQVVHFEHHPRASRLELSHPNLLKKTVVYIETFAHQGGRQLGIAQVKEDSVRMRDALRSELDVVFHVNRYPRVVRGRPVANRRHARNALRLRPGGMR